MAKYQIGKEVKDIVSKAGKPFKKFNVKDEKGVITNDVVAFPFFSLYSSIISGGTVEAVLSDSDYNGQKSYKLIDGNLGAKPQGFGGGMAKTMEKKAEYIEKAQGRKADSIQEAATARDATLILTSYFRNGVELPTEFDDLLLQRHEVKVMNMWRRIRSWLMKNWEVQDTLSDGSLMPDFTTPKGYPDSFTSKAEEEVVNFPSDEDTIPF